MASPPGPDPRILDPALNACLAGWLPTLGQERTQPFTANLAFLLDLVIARAIDLERARVRRGLAALLGDEAPERLAAEPVLALLAEPLPVRRRGRSSRSVS